MIKQGTRVRTAKGETGTVQDNPTDTATGAVVTVKLDPEFAHLSATGTADLPVADLTRISRRSPKRCGCSDDCPATTTRLFSQGHDARMVSRLVAAVATGNLSPEVAKKELLTRGGTDRLAAKLNAALNRPTRSKRQTVTVRAKVGRWEHEGCIEAGEFVYQTKDGQTRRTARFQLVNP